MSRIRAFTLPFLVFMLILGLSGAPHALGASGFWFSQPQYWSFPLQTLVCGALILWYWRDYELQLPKELAFTTCVALFVLAAWVSPQEFFGFSPRTSGFDPTVFSPGTPAYFINLGVRFLRLVVVVPILEEVFWRGFLLRILIDEPFEKVPLGSFSWYSFGAVTLCFGLAHWGPDFPAALLTGALYNLVVIRTKSLSSCILAHAITNLGLGIYILHTKQWGFW